MINMEYPDITELFFMDVSDILTPYKFFIGLAAALFTCLQFITSFIFIYKMRQRGTSDGYPIEKFLGGFATTIFGLKLGELMPNDLIIHINSAGVVINLILLVEFFTSASSPLRLIHWIKSLLTIALITTCILYSENGDQIKVEYHLSFIITSIIVLVTGMQILRYNTKYRQPLVVSCIDMLTGFMWLLYGTSLYYKPLIYQNFAILLLNSFQVFRTLLQPEQPEASTQPDNQASAAQADVMVQTGPSVCSIDTTKTSISFPKFPDSRTSFETRSSSSFIYPNFL